MDEDAEIVMILTDSYFSFNPNAGLNDDGSLKEGWAITKDRYDNLSDEFVGSYMGKEVLDLQMTTNLYNDSPFAGPMTDVQAYWENPFRSDVQ